MISRPPQITDRHLTRRAVAYIRQSSPEQVRANIGSAEVQRDLAPKLAAWGWPASMIETLDGDLGISGARAGARNEFNHLLARMEAGEIGLVAVVDISRLSRNIVDLCQFIDRALRHDVLLAQDNQIIDFNDPNSFFLAGIFGLNAIRDNRARAQLSVQARWKKAAAGLAPTPPPVGYVRGRDGHWSKDPDDRVRDTITVIFDKALELGSIRGTLRYLRTHNVQVPRRRWRNRPPWQDATYPQINGFLRNPVYAGHYVFGQTRQEPAEPGSGKRGRQRPQPSTEWVVLEAHHEPYVPPAPWRDLQRRIASNSPSVLPPASRGEALVPGILHCSLHQRKFQVVYKDRERGEDGSVRRPASYICLPPIETPDAWRTHTIKASFVDAVVERLLLETLTPLALDGVHEAVRQELRQHERLERSRQDELRRLQQGADEAERAYLQTDLANPHLKKRMEERAERALQDLDRLRLFHRRDPLIPPLSLDDATLAELGSLLSDLPRLWRHPSVTPQQRKAIARTAFTRVHLTMTGDTWPLEVEWVSGARTVLGLTREDRVRARPTGPLRRWRIALSTYQVIRDQVEEGTSIPGIAERLSELGVRHRSGPWTPNGVKAAIYRLRRGQIFGVEPLSHLPTLTDHVRVLHAAGYAPVQMVAQLRSQGITTRDQTVVTRTAVYAALRRLKLRPHSSIMKQRASVHVTGASTTPEAAP